MLPSYPETTRRTFARNILRNTLRVGRGENLLIETWSSTVEWAESVALEARILGARPLLILEDEATYWRSVAEAPPAHIGRVGSHDWAALKSSDAYVYFYGPFDTEREEKLPRSVERRVLADNHEWFRIIEKQGIRCARWDLGRTNEAAAARYGVSVETWRRELIESGSMDPRPMQRDGARVGRALRRGHEVTISHPNGTELTLRLRRRPPHVDDGIVDEADVRSGDVFCVVPSGVVNVAVDETYAEGTFVANVTGVMFVQGQETPLRGARWTFRKGKLADFEYDAGGEAFRRAYAKLGAGKERPALLGIGLNPQLGSIPLLFDQGLGVITIAIGRNSMMGGSTRTPHFSAFQSIRGGSLRVDDEPIVEGGRMVGGGAPEA